MSAKRSKTNVFRRIGCDYTCAGVAGSSGAGTPVVTRRVPASETSCPAGTLAKRGAGTRSCPRPGIGRRFWPPARRSTRDRRSGKSSTRYRRQRTLFLRRGASCSRRRVVSGKFPALHAAAIIDDGEGCVGGIGQQADTCRARVERVGAHFHENRFLDRTSVGVPKVFERCWRSTRVSPTRASYRGHVGAPIRRN